MSLERNILILLEWDSSFLKGSVFLCFNNVITRRLRYLDCLGRYSSNVLLETFADFFKIELYSDDSINMDSQVKKILKFVYLG